jgi:hypothetical protein
MAAICERLASILLDSLRIDASVFAQLKITREAFQLSHTHTHTRENSRFVQLIYYIPTIVIERLRAWLAQVGEHGSQLLVKTKNRHLQKVTQRSIYLSLSVAIVCSVCVSRRLDILSQR